MAFPQDSAYRDQQSWNEVDFTSAPPPGNYYYPSFRDIGSYDPNSIPADGQNAPSPDYSQFLNFEPSDVGSYTLPNEGIPRDTLFQPSGIPLNNPLQTTGFPVKIEPDLVRNDSLVSGLRNYQAGEFNPQGAGQAPNCQQVVSLPDIEECSPNSCLPSTLGSFTDQDNSLKLARTTSKESRSTRKPKKGRRGSSSEEDESAQLRAKQAHSIVERRYRDNLNGKIMQLHRALVSTESATRQSGLPSKSFFSGTDHRSKVRKSDVMTDAMNYIHQSEVSMRHMHDEITRLTDRVQALEKLVKCEDCTLLKQMVRLQLQAQQQQQQQPPQ